MSHSRFLGLSLDRGWQVKYEGIAIEPKDWKDIVNIARTTQVRLQLGFDHSYYSREILDDVPFLDDAEEFERFNDAVQHRSHKGGKIAGFHVFPFLATIEQKSGTSEPAGTGSATASNIDGRLIEQDLTALYDLFGFDSTERAQVNHLFWPFGISMAVIFPLVSLIYLGSFEAWWTWRKNGTGLMKAPESTVSSSHHPKQVYEVTSVTRQ
ncbi:hypothetical protein EK21DRAFT_110946 [Setomelanomma holmii]|uniref:Uncharacterized protein n=1 Tax=Setomelanomma holmii TaxID=210430 RepID=A0A9P4HB05_9PLEO|nr:hypothetical protein EK21DRAFT_110946 [Setomelanomma holmii]